MKKNISFCQTCRNRLWQLRETLSSNLRALDKDCEIVLVDYGSTDGLSKWVWENYSSFIENGSLVFFEVHNKVCWSMPRAKNLAHRLSGGDYLFSLDADNFVTAADIRMIREISIVGAPCHQFSGDFSDGSHGRIGLPRSLFFEIGGYDETMLPMGGQDMDLLRRLAVLKKSIAALRAPLRSAILNSHSQKMAAVIPESSSEDIAKQGWEKMEVVNQTISRIRLATEGPIRLGGFQTFQGRLNGKMIIIDGMNHIRSDEP